MGTHGTTQHSTDAGLRRTLGSQWERSHYGGLTLRWRRVYPGNALSEAEAARAQDRADRDLSVWRSRGARKRLIAAAAVVALYFFTVLGICSILAARDVSL